MEFKAVFVSVEEDDKDLIVSFAIQDEPIGVKSLILHRTLFFEGLLPEEERGVNVSLEGDHLADEALNMLELIELSNQQISIKTPFRRYVVDVSGIDNTELSELALLVEKQNYDKRFEVKYV